MFLIGSAGLATHNLRKRSLMTLPIGLADSAAMTLNPPNPRKQMIFQIG
jgi:hypothetical protein